MKTYVARLITLALLLVGISPAASLVNPQNLNIAGQIDQWTNTLVDQHIGIFTAEGLDMLHSVTVILLVYMLCVMLMSQSFHIEKVIQFVFTYLLAYSMLQFYDSPLPGANGVSFHGMFAAEARWIAATLDLTTLDDLTTNTVNIMKKLQHPGPLNIAGTIVYVGMQFDFAIIWFLSFGVTAVGYIGTGCFSLIGPLCIPFLLWHELSFIFWGWLRSMLGYAFIRVFASCIIYVYAHVMMYVLNGVINNDFTLGHFAAIVWPLLALNLGFLFALCGACIAMSIGLFSAAGGLSSPFSGAARAISSKILA